MESLSVFFFQKSGIHLSFDIDVLDPTVAPATGSHISPRHYPLIPLIFLSSVKCCFNKMKYLMRLDYTCLQCGSRFRSKKKFTNKPDFRPFEKALHPDPH